VLIKRDTEPCLVAATASRPEPEDELVLVVLADEVASLAKYCCHSVETEFGSS